MKIDSLRDPVKTIQYHDELNPALWDGTVLKPEVQEKLLLIAEQFKEYLKIPDLKVKDIVITGSSAGYNWTPMRDIDLHLIVDFKQFRKICPELIEDYLNSKKRIWNDARNISIYGFEVELYVEDRAEEAVSAGTYSLLNDEWVNEPRHEDPTFDHKAVRRKVKHLMDIIDNLPPCRNSQAIDRFRDKIWSMRQAGLSKNGEWRTENLTFKVLRNMGYLDKLIDCGDNAKDRELSLE